SPIGATKNQFASAPIGGCVFFCPRDTVMIPETLRSYGRDRKGNVAIIFALSLIPAVFLIGMALDFTSAMHRRSQLDAAADAGALAAVTPSMMMQSDAAALTAATNIFNAEASAMSGVSNTTPTVTITPSNGGLTRTALVSYNAWSINNFPNVLGQSNWTISGSSTATATAAPNINFYLLLDNSPSMDLPATSAGITAMINATQNAPANGGNAGGCAFACHESNPAGDNLGNPNGEDNYTLAQNLGVVTRIQNMNTATQSLMTTASTMEVSNNVTYQMAIYTFNYSGTNTIQALTSDLTAAQNAAQGINVLEVYDNNYLTSTNDNNDTDTDFDTAMQQMNTIMPNPGTGAANSTPQEVLFLVTDGVEDKVDTPVRSRSLAVDVSSPSTRYGVRR
ncbi:MAG: TadE/TadG family type IV pilus assembly protein, partial [Steroidobacteraceae bacterium]